MDKQLQKIIYTIYPYRTVKLKKYNVNEFTVQKHTTFRKKDKTVLLGFNKEYNDIHLYYNGKFYRSNNKVEDAPTLAKQSGKKYYIPFIVDNAKELIKPTVSIWDLIRQFDYRIKEAVSIKGVLDILYDKKYIESLLKLKFVYPKILFRDEDKKSYRVHFDVRFPINGKLFSFVIAKEPPNKNRRRLGVLRMPDHPADYQYYQGIVFQDYGYGQVELADIGKIKFNEIKDNVNNLTKIDVTLDGEFVLRGNYTLIKDSKKQIVWYFIYKKHQTLKPINVK